MKRLILTAALGACLLASACGHSQVTTNPQVKQDLSKGEAIVQGCIAKSTNPRAIVRCVAPAGHSVALEHCALTAASRDFLHRARLAQDLAVCVTRYR